MFGKRYEENVAGRNEQVENCMIGKGQIIAHWRKKERERERSRERVGEGEGEGEEERERKRERKKGIYLTLPVTQNNIYDH